MNEGRLRDVLWMAVAIQLSVFVAIVPDLFPLVLVSVLVTLNAVFNEGIRWLDAYSGA
jgi:hypothetical protein